MGSFLGYMSLDSSFSSSRKTKSNREDLFFGIIILRSAILATVSTESEVCQKSGFDSRLIVAVVSTRDMVVEAIETFIHNLGRLI